MAGCGALEGVLFVGSAPHLLGGDAALRLSRLLNAAEHQQARHGARVVRQPQVEDGSAGGPEQLGGGGRGGGG